MSRDTECADFIIVKRRSRGGDEGHHGGVWKIAFADFMTAMMAFFLVLWLVNSTNKAAKESIVQYFNPVQLVANSQQDKGLDTRSESKEEPEGEEKSEPKGKAGSEASLSREASAEATQAGAETAAPGPVAEAQAAAQAIFAQPEDMLAALEAKAAVPAPAPALGSDDPFAPAANRLQSAPPPPQAAAPDQTPVPAPVPAPAPAPAASRSPPAQDAAIEQALRQAAAQFSGGAHVELQQTGEGLLVSIIDNGPQPMFASGAAEPSPALVRLMRGIGETLAERDGTIVIRGHTDSRPFRAGGYDNWRLSSDRAQMARIMLLRGGVAAERIERIEGHGARKPRLPEAPEAAENRRIDILLRTVNP